MFIKPFKDWSILPLTIIPANRWIALHVFMVVTCGLGKEYEEPFYLGYLKVGPFAYMRLKRRGGWYISILGRRVMGPGMADE